VNGLEEQIEAGRIELVSFANPGGLEAVGENLYAATADSGEARSGAPGENGLGFLRQGFLESSNVQMIDELVTLMLAQRAFEMNGRIVQAADQMLAITNGLYRSS
jgi:flagellar basal-body rod protein FlgG